jgi:hypothetical protein
VRAFIIDVVNLRQRNEPDPIAFVKPDNGCNWSRLASVGLERPDDRCLDRRLYAPCQGAGPSLSLLGRLVEPVDPKRIHGDLVARRDANFNQSRQQSKVDELSALNMFHADFG